MDERVKRAMSLKGVNNIYFIYNLYRGCAINFLTGLKLWFQKMNEYLQNPHSLKVQIIRDECSCKE